MYIIQFKRNKKTWYYIRTKEVEDKIRVTAKIEEATKFESAMVAGLIASQNKGQVIKDYPITTIWVDEKPKDKQDDLIKQYYQNKQKERPERIYVDVAKITGSDNAKK